MPSEVPYKHLSMVHIFLGVQWFEGRKTDKDLVLRGLFAPCKPVGFSALKNTKACSFEVFWKWVLGSPKETLSHYSRLPRGQPGQLCDQLISSAIQRWPSSRTRAGRRVTSAATARPNSSAGIQRGVRCDAAKALSLVCPTPLTAWRRPQGCRPGALIRKNLVHFTPHSSYILCLSLAS